MSDFPTKENPQLCKNGCDTKIYLSNKNDKKKWLPYELDGEFHECPNKPGLDKFATTTTTTITKDDVSTPTLPNYETLTVKDLVDRLAKNGIYIDVKAIMKPKEKQE